MAATDYNEFVALKRALQHYSEYRASLPDGELERTSRELGELLITLVSVADRHNVDLVRAAEEAVALRAQNVPQLVQIARPGDPKLR
jgi:NTP pyrophosphatase (non-canonical NTP hydrolase)